MSGDFLKDLIMIEVYFENENQKVLLSKDRNTGNLFLVNAIVNKKAIEGINIDTISATLDSIERIEETEEAICIITRYYNYLNIKDYLSSNHVSLSTQIKYGSTILNRLKKLKGLPTYAIASLFNDNNILIDESGNIRFLDIVILDSNYTDISLFDIFNELSGTLHIVFSGERLEDNKISEKIPPDIERIIQKCMDGEYIRYEEIINEFKASKLYRLINPEIEEGKRVHKIRRSLTRRRIGFRLKKRGILIGIILVMIFPLIILGIGKFNDKGIPTNDSDNQVAIENNVSHGEKKDEDTNQITQENEFEDESVATISMDESLVNFFYEGLPESLNIKNSGSIDTSQYYDGTYSIKVEKFNENNVDYWVGRIDLTSDDFNSLKNRNVDFSVRIKSNKSTGSSFTLNLYKNNKLLGTVSKNIDLVEGIWTLYSMNLNTTNGDYIDVFFTPNNEGHKIWLDALAAEILK